MTIQGRLEIIIPDNVIQTAEDYDNYVTDYVLTLTDAFVKKNRKCDPNFLASNVYIDFREVWWKQEIFLVDSIPWNSDERAYVYVNIDFESILDNVDITMFTKEWLYIYVTDQQNNNTYTGWACFYPRDTECEELLTILKSETFDDITIIKENTIQG